MIDFLIPKELDHASCPHLSQVARPVDGTWHHSLKWLIMFPEKEKERMWERRSILLVRGKTTPKGCLNIVPIKFP